MWTLKDNIWKYEDKAVICITTNGFVKKDGTAVMGRGIALQAKETFHGIDAALGRHITQHGNNVGIIWTAPVICSFPVKPISIIKTPKVEVVKHMKDKFKDGDRIPGWAVRADLETIERSAKQLRQLADEKNWELVVLTKPGCNNGELQWKHVEPILDKYLSTKRFVVIDRTF